MKHSFFRWFFLLLALTALGCLNQASADTVALGSDYLHTEPGTFFDFGPGIGVVPLMGKPIGPADTDTIVHRLADAAVTPGGPGATIPIELVALSLESVAPVNIGGSFFDVFVTLDPSHLGDDTGMMTIQENPAGTGGTFTSFFDVFFEVDFTPVGGGPVVKVFNSLTLSNSDAPWVATVDPRFVQVMGPCGDQEANVHTGCEHLDFFIDGTVREVHPETGAHVVREAEVPEPATFTLLATGVAGLWGLGRKRRQR